MLPTGGLSSHTWVSGMKRRGGEAGRAQRSLCQQRNGILGAAFCSWDALQWEAVEATLLGMPSLGQTGSYQVGSQELPAPGDPGDHTMSLNITAPLASPAVKVKGEYVVAGKGKISLNVTYPSVLEDNQIKYQVFLTKDNLPSLEEIHVDGPTQEEIEIQVNESSRAGRGPGRRGQVWVALLQNPGVVDSGDFVSKARGDGAHCRVIASLFWGMAGAWLPTGFLQVWG